MFQLILASSILCLLILLGDILNLIQMFFNKDERYGTATLETKSRHLSMFNKGIAVNASKRMTQKNSQSHVFLASPSGSNKTQGFVLPNVLKLNQSMVIIDIKGEIHELCSGYLAKNNFKIINLDLGNIQHSARYNPLCRIKDDSGVRKFCELIYEMGNRNAKTELVWRIGAIEIMEIVLKALLHAPAQYQTMNNLIQLLNAVPTDPQLPTRMDKVLPFIVAYSQGNMNIDTVKRYVEFRNRPINLQSGQKTGAVSALTQFNTYSMKQIMEADDFDFQLLRKQKTAIFLKLPIAQQTAFTPLLTLFFNDLFDFLLSTPYEKGDQNIYILGEEIANIPRIPNLPALISLVRSQKVSVSLVCQTIDKLIEIYGKDDCNNILGNCSSQLIFGGSLSIHDLEYYSKLIGVGSHQELDTITGQMQTTKRPVLTLDEIRRLPADKLLYLFRNENAALVDLNPLYKDYMLQFKAGLRSKGGRLVPSYQPIHHTARPLIDPLYYDLEKLWEQAWLTETPSAITSVTNEDSDGKEQQSGLVTATE